jgi:RNA polymerase sigma factor (sigma-70 family)
MAEESLGGALRHLRKLAAVRSSREEEDRLLLERFVQVKDQATFAVLVERHGPMVLGVCRRSLGNAHDAEDACQATFLVLARQAASVRKTTSLGSWLHGVACRVVANLKRERLRRHRRERAAEPPALPDPPAEASWREVQAALDEELERLPERLRGPLVLCYLEGLTRDAAAARLDLSVGSLHGLLERGRKLLRDRLTRRGFTLSAALFGTALGEGIASAGLSPTLVVSLARAATLLAAGQPVGAGVPSAVLVLMRGVLKTMFLTRLKRDFLLAVCAGLLLSTVGGLLASARSHQAAKLPAAKEAPPDVAPAAFALDGDKRPLPAGAVRRLGSRRFRVAGRNSFALPTPDGKYLLVQPQPALSGYAVQGLALVALDTGLPVRMFEDSRRVPKSGVLEAIRPAAFSPDGKKLYALAWHSSERDGDGFAQWANFDNPCKRVLLVWDVATGKRTAEWELPPGGWPGSSLLGVTVSPDGKRLFVYGAIRMRAALGGRGRGVPGIHVLDSATGRKFQTWEEAGHPVGMTAGGKELITFRRGAAITAHDAKTGKPERSFPLAGYVPSVALSADGKTVAAVAIAEESGKRTYQIKVWEAGSGRELRRMTVGGQASYSARLAFSDDGKALFLGTGTGRILRLEVAGGRVEADWPAHSGYVSDLWLRPGANEVLSTGEYDGAVRRWDARTGNRLSVTDAYTGEIAVARTPDGKGMAVVDRAGRLDLWDVRAGRVTKTLQTPGRSRHLLRFTPDGKHLLVAAETGPSTVWDLAGGKQVGELAPPPKKDPKAADSYWGMLDFSPDGRHLLASKFGRGTWAWSWPEKGLLWHEAKEQESCFFPDDATVVSGDWHREIEFRDVRTGAVKRTLSGGLSSVTYSPDRARMVTAHLDGAWRVRDGATGAVLKEVKAFQYAWSVAFSPTGWLLAVAGDNSVRVYDSATWGEVARLDGHEGTVRTVFFGPSDATLVSASAEDGTALVWSLKPPASRKPPDPAALWADLAGDGPAMRRAVWSAAAHPEVAVRLFREKWPVSRRPVDAKRIRKLIADLDSSAAASRDAASAELEKLGQEAEAELRKELEATESAEVKRRVRRLLARLAPPAGGGYSPEDARELRAVWALELAGTKEARKLLADWAEARVGHRLGVEAAAAVRRWRGRE